MKRKITGYSRDPVIVEKTGMSLTTIWRLRKKGKFPRKTQLSENISATANGGIDDWRDDPKGWSVNEKGIATWVFIPHHQKL
jgi:predicted DNA-binding transcriptional regulator AlpA